MSIDLSPTDVQPPLPAIARGEGPDVVLIPGYGLGPMTYLRTAELLAERGRVVVPGWLHVHGAWTYRGCLDALEATLRWYGVDRYTLLAHSFGGGLALGLAARDPDRVVDLVFCDTVGLTPRWGLAWNAVQGSNLLKLATAQAAVDFIRSCITSPVSLGRAGWWGFRSDMSSEVERVGEGDIRSHVLWAERDTLLARADGERFADRIGASFHVVDDPEGPGPVDHDWMFRHPKLFAEVIFSLGLPDAPAYRP